MRGLDKWGMAATALSILLVLSLTTTVAMAQEDDNEQGMEREVKVNVETDKVEIESKLEKENTAGEVENSFEVEFKLSEEVEIKLEYEEEFEYEDNDNIEIESELELEYKVEFDSIIEFVDNDNDGLFDEGEEVSVYELDGAEFLPIDYTTELTPENVMAHVITTQTVDGIFKVTLYALGDFATIHEEIVRPTEIKIDLEIDNFPYEDENSKLALKCRIESEMEVEHEKVTEVGEEKVEIEHENYQGFFSWKTTALVDGVEREVKSTTLEEDPEEGEKKLYLIYEHGTSIVHDPKIGVLGAIGGAVGVAQAMPWVIVIVAAIIAALISIGVARYTVLRQAQ